MLSTSNMPLSPNEVLVDLTGGTPEVIVAGIVMGFSKVMFLANADEVSMMSLPSKEDERLHQIDFENYVPPPDGPFSGGTLAASAVETLAPYVANHVMGVEKSWKVDARLISYPCIPIMNPCTPRMPYS